MSKTVFNAFAVILCLPAVTGTAGAQTGALDRQYLGLFPAEQFRIVTGRCADCDAPPQALWYFRDEYIAVPRAGAATAGFSRSLPVAEDVRQWVAGSKGAETPPPPLVWIGSPALLEHATMSMGTITGADGRRLALGLTARIPTNRSFYDHSSAAFFSGRPLRLRGRVPDGEPGRFVARAIWPEDFTLPYATMQPEPRSSLSGLITAENGGVRSAYAAHLLWERDPGRRRDWGGHAVLGLMLNGAQGDDDEAHGGHFAVFTGIMGRDGQWCNWLVSNFYNLDSVSEKGILAAMVPADDYLTDLNSGQSWYRPSCIAALVLDKERCARIFQGAVERVYNRFYRHDFVYDHARANCTGISMDVLRWIGWDIPKTGPTSRVKAIPGFFYKWYEDRSFSSGVRSYNYLVEEQTRLLPRAGFEAAVSDLMNILDGTPPRPLTTFEQMLRTDADGLLFARIPQIPSSRAPGTFPVASFDEYSSRLPSDKSRMKIIPVADRPFPSSLKDAEAYREPGGMPLPIPIFAIFLAAGLGCAAVIRKAVRRR